MLLGCSVCVSWSGRCCLLTLTCYRAGSGGAGAAGSVVAAVDPQFVPRFKQLKGLGRDSRVLLLDS